MSSGHRMAAIPLAVKNLIGTTPEPGARWSGFATDFEQGGITHTSDNEEPVDCSGNGDVGACPTTSLWINASTALNIAQRAILATALASTCTETQPQRAGCAPSAAAVSPRRPNLSGSRPTSGGNCRALGCFRSLRPGAPVEILFSPASGASSPPHHRLLPVSMLLGRR